jgi:hypothetical protein
MMRPSVPSPTGTAIGAGIADLLAAHEARWCPWRRSARSIAKVLGDLEHRRWPWFLVSSALRIAQAPFELHVDDGADDLGDVSDWIGHGWSLVNS